MSTIPMSSTYDNNFTTKAYTSELIAESLTDGISTFSGGTIVDLIPPTNLQDAVTKAFVDGLVTVAPPVNSVQFNNLVFAGSSNLTFIPNTLTVNGTITDSSGVSITGGIISGLNDPIASDQIATKNYVDSSSSTTTNNYIKSDIGVTYTAAQMINGIILRNLATDNTFGVSLTDTTATAAQLVAFVPSASVGYAAKFKIMNDNPDANGATVEGRDSFALSINPGTGVTFYPNNTFTIRRGYMLDAFIQFTNIIVPAVTIIITRCAYSGPSIYLAPVPFGNTNVFKNTVDYLNYNACSLKGNLFWNLNDVSSVSNNYSYTTSDIKNQLIVRNPTGVATDTLGFIIDPRYMDQIMTIQNPSAFTITVSGQTNIWNLIPNPITIPTNKQVIFSILANNPGLTNVGSNYNFGVYNTSGGTGSGMTITVTAVDTVTNLITGGLTYVDGISTTTNLTTPGATGLEVYIRVDEGTGQVTNVQRISNYLNGGYQTGDIIQINGGDGNATFQLSDVNSISSYFINTLGDGAYLSTDVLNISGPGTGSGAQITLGSFITVRLIGKFSL
jgi:hypothetical protein